MFNLVKIREGHDNFFTPLRLLMAVMVLVGHAFHVAEGSSYAHVGMAEPKIFFNYEASYLAVNMFFIVSGFLVTKSMLYRQNIAVYASARILRIFPALLFHVIFVMFVIGPIATQLPLATFFSDPQFYSQPLQVLSFYETSMTLPGAFEGNPQQVASIPLWTLRYEVLAYIGTVLVFSLGLLRNNWMILAQFILCVGAWLGLKFSGAYETLLPTLQVLLRFGICYSLGAAIYAYRKRLGFHILGLPIALLIAALFNNTPLFEIAINLCLAYFIFWAAYLKLPKLAGLSKISDVSYGIYIYHYCILQSVYYVYPSVTTLVLIAITLPVTVTLALVSWHVIEKPALGYKKQFADIIRFKRLSLRA